MKTRRFPIHFDLLFGLFIRRLTVLFYRLIAFPLLGVLIITLFPWSALRRGFTLGAPYLIKEESDCDLVDRFRLAAKILPAR